MLWWFRCIAIDVLLLTLGINDAEGALFCIQLFDCTGVEDARSRTFMLCFTSQMTYKRMSTPYCFETSFVYYSIGLYGTRLNQPLLCTLLQPSAHM